MDVGDIIGTSFKIYLKNFWRLFAIVAIGFGIPAMVNFVLIIIVFFSAFLSGIFTEPTPSNLVAETNGLEPFGLTFLVILGIAVLVSVLFGIFIYPVVYGALIYGASLSHFQRPISIGGCYRYAFKRYWRLVGANLLVSLVIFALGITIIGIPFAVYLAIRWILIHSGIILEDLSIKGSLHRSTQLVKNNWWRIFGIVILLALITFGIDYGIQIIPFLGWLLVLVGITTPLVTTGVLYLYFDLRIRKEGYRLEDMKSEVMKEA